MNTKLHVPGLDDAEQETLDELVAELEKHRRRDRLRSSLYDGKNLVRRLQAALPPQYSQLGLAIGWSGKAVDGLARRCNLDGFNWPDGSLADLGYDNLVEENFLLSELSQARTDSLLHGVSFLIATHGMPGEPSALVHGRDALNATGLWNERTRSLRAALSVTAWRDDEIDAFVLYLDGVTISAEHETGRWKVSERSGHPWGVPVQALVYKPRLSKRMGRSRITRPVISLQLSALRSLYRLEAHADIYALPKWFLLGASDAIFRNEDGSPKSNFEVIMGRLLAIPDDPDADDPALARADVKQFAAASPAPHLAHLNALAKSMARETDLPDSDFALTDMANPTSADAYNASRENLFSEAEGAMTDWTVPTLRSLRTGLAIRNGLSESPTEWGSIIPSWRSPAYTSKAALADAGSKVLAAVPWLKDTRIGLELAGLNERQIAMAMAEQRRAAGRQVIAALAARPQPAPAG